MFNDENENIINNNQTSESESFDEKNESVYSFDETNHNKDFVTEAEVETAENDFEFTESDFESDVEKVSDNTENVYTYSYEDADFSYDEEEIDVRKKGLKKWAFAGVGLGLVVCLVAGTLIGFSLGNKQQSKESYFHQSNAAQMNQNTQTEQFVPDGAELSTEDIAAKVGPAVVGIINKTNAISFFNMASESSGSGVIINEEGYIVTNFHVIENARELKVILNTGKEYPATVVGYDQRSDLAVLKIEENGLTYANFGDSSYVNVGSRVIAIGNPLGTELMGTVTQGIISAVNRTVNIEDKTLTLLQTDAAINSGNSGGPLVNAYGEVIGINSVKMAATGVEGIGFAIPSNEVKAVVDDLINNGYVTGRLMVGVSGTNITEKLSKYYDLPVGFYVNEVYEGYGAYLAGVQSGDVIIKCDGKSVSTVDDINEIRDTHKVGDMMEIVVWRNGKEVTLKIRMMEENPEITQ